MKATVYWNGEEALARECEVMKNGAAPPGHVVIICAGGSDDATVPMSWIHTDPEIPEGTLCYGWNGDTKPGRPFVGWYDGDNSEGHRMDLGTRAKDYSTFDHIEPVSLAKPIKIKWDAIPKGMDVAEWDSGLTDYVLNREVGYESTRGDHIIAIHHRPKEQQS